jgi:hypothetical protein
VKIFMGEKSFVLDLEHLMNVEQIAMEDATGHTFEELVALLNRGSRKAITSFGWIFLKREDPTLTFADVTFAEGELRIEMDADEKALAEDPKDDSPTPEVNEDS